MLSGQIGPALQSDSGFPEGCGMSCTAMALCNVVYHKYMSVYARVTALSFVDNLEALGVGCTDLHEGIVVMQQWAQMFHFELDDKKSYVWANDAKLRGQCALLGWVVRTHAKDLGAPMTYGAKHSVVEQMERIKSLKPLWLLLRRMSIPFWAKQRLVTQAFWPRAFYGSAICCMSWEHIKHLRTEALRAPRFGRGGANPGMRLGILCSPTMDPGYYQFWHTLMTFQRIARKQVGFVHLWISFMHSYQGDHSYGPFGKLLEVCGQVGWMIDAPFITDQDGFRFNLLQIDVKLLERLAIDAWRQSIAHEFGRRKDIAELDGVDWRVIHAVMQKRPYFQLQTLHVLQDGTFLEKSKHKRYDLSQTGRCHLCNMEDTLEHRCRSCPQHPTQMSCRCGIIFHKPSLCAYSLHTIHMRDSTSVVLKMQNQNVWGYENFQPDNMLTSLQMDHVYTQHFLGLLLEYGQSLVQHMTVLLPKAL